MQHFGDSYHKINKCIISRESWTKNDDNQLKKAIKNFGFDWLLIAQTFSNRNPNQCSQRWNKLFIKKQFWSDKEDKKLIQLFNTFGRKWRLIIANFNGRTAIQCRNQYINKLDPNLKATEFTVSEDQIIYQKYLLLGSKWSKIVKFLPSIIIQFYYSSQDQGKNRFYSVIRTDYLQVRNPYFTKQSQEEAKNELIKVRKQHLNLIQNNQKPLSQHFNDNLKDQQSTCFNCILCFISGLNPNSEMNCEF